MLPYLFTDEEFGAYKAAYITHVVNKSVKFQIQKV